MGEMQADEGAVWEFAGFSGWEGDWAAPLLRDVRQKRHDEPGGEDADDLLGGVEAIPDERVQIRAVEIAAIRGDLVEDDEEAGWLRQGQQEVECRRSHEDQ